jgi:cysteine-rich repeat protein
MFVVILTLAVILVSGCSSEHGQETVSLQEQALGLCGDGVLDAGEECDDGDWYNENECSDACTIAVCGDGIVQTAGATGHASDDEQCEPAEDPWCAEYCLYTYCGNGVVDEGEECDDAMTCEDASRCWSDDDCVGIGDDRCYERDSPCSYECELQ